MIVYAYIYQSIAGLCFQTQEMCRRLTTACCNNTLPATDSGYLGTERTEIGKLQQLNKQFLIMINRNIASNPLHDFSCDTVPLLP